LKTLLKELKTYGFQPFSTLFIYVEKTALFKNMYFKTDFCLTPKQIRHFKYYETVKSDF